jgi:2-polyprenyl-3-methyl-5-hydroxy-6-metoxy-1,4-benzoquinol methylase
LSSSKKINWLGTWASFSTLKILLGYRINGEKNKFWIQEPKTNKVDIYNRVDFILNYCKNKSVLHIGCTDFPFTREKFENKSLLHENLKQVAKSVIGLDNNEESIRDYVALTGDKNIFYCDINEMYPKEIEGEKFDVILLSEVLEHLINPSKAIAVLKNSFAEGTKVLVTVPNYSSIQAIAASLNQKETIHPDHYWYFSPYTLTRLFQGANFVLEELNFGMYYQRDTKINIVMKKFPFNGDCIIAIFSIK